MPTASCGSRSTSPARPPTCSPRACSRSSATLLEPLAGETAEGRGDPLGQAERLRRRRRHQGIHQLQERHGCVRADPRRPAGARPARSAALPHGRRHSRLRARRRARARARVPLSRRGRATSACRSACRKCSSAFIRASAARCARVRLIGVKPAMEMMLTGRPVRADKALRLGLVDRLVTAAELEAAAREHHRARSRRVIGRRSREQVLSWPIVRSFVKPALHRAGREQGEARALPCAVRHHRSVGAITARAASRRSKPKRARSRICSPARPRAISCACSCCRIG